MIITMKKGVERGFTVIELLIATTVFSTVILLGLTGFVQIGRSYYKGVTISQTNEAARQVLNEVSANIRLGSSVSSLGQAGSGRFFYCVGSHRYTFMTFNMVDSGNHDNVTKFGLLQDSLSGDNACGNPFGNPAVPLNNPVELLSNQMRLLKFNISSVGGNSKLYSVDLSVAYGQDSALTDPASADAQCKLNLGGTQFCAITKLSTVVYEGI